MPITRSQTAKKGRQHYITPEAYITAARKGDNDTVTRYLANSYGNHPTKEKSHPYAKHPHETQHHQAAFLAAAKNGQDDIVTNLLNYGTASSATIISEKTKKNAVAQAFSNKAYATTTLIISHLNDTDPKTYNNLRMQLSATWSKINVNGDADNHPLTEAMLALLQHQPFKSNEMLLFKALRDIGIGHGCTKVIDYILNHCLTREWLDHCRQNLLAFDIIKSKHSDTLLQAFPDFYQFFIGQVASDNYDTPLIAAARLNKLSLMKKIHEYDPEQLNKVNREYKNALMVAAESETPTKEAIKWLLDKEMDITELLPDSTNISVLASLAKNPVQKDAFKMAVAYPDERITELLYDNDYLKPIVKNLILSALPNTYQPNLALAKEVDFSALYALNNQRMPGLNNQLNKYMLAAHYHQHDQMKAWEVHEPISSLSTMKSMKLSGISACLFSHAVDIKNRYRVSSIHDKDANGRTALHHLMVDVNQNMGEWLWRTADELAEEAAENSDDQKDADLFQLASDLIAIEHNETSFYKTLTFLLSNKADPNMPDEHGNTPLHYAILSRRSPATIEAMLYHRACVHKKNKDGTTPLIIACSQSGVSTVELLLAAGADPTIEDKEKRTPLNQAYENHNDGDDALIIQGLILEAIEKKKQAMRPTM
jgi:hypothetical protein